MTTHSAERRLAQAARALAYAQRIMPKSLATLAAITPDGWSRGGLHEGSGGGPVVRVTDELGQEEDVAATGVEAAALNGLETRETYRRIDAVCVEIHGMVRQLIRELEEVPDLGVDTAADATRLRCSGGEGEWADPTCVRIAERTVPSLEQGGKRLHVCWACLKRRQRAGLRSVDSDGIESEGRIPTDACAACEGLGGRWTNDGEWEPCPLCTSTEAAS